MSLRSKVRALRHRVIAHRKSGRPSRVLERAYRRAKSELAVARRRRSSTTIVSRDQWGAARPRTSYSPLGKLRAVTLHHTAFHTKNRPLNNLRDECAMMREMQQWHFARGFSDLGYHRVVAPSGRVFEGRPLNALGAHVGNHNTGNPGISVMGNFELERPTPAALAAVRRLHREIAGKVPMRGHKDWDGHRSNACPGKHLYHWMNEENRT